MGVTHRRREPAPGVFRLVLPLPFPGLEEVNAYLLAGQGPAVLVDCGINDPSSPDGGLGELESALAAVGASLDDVGRLIVTHPHIDHYGLAGRVKERSGCELVMHPAAVAELRQLEDPQASEAELAGMLADHGVPSGELGELTAFEDQRPFISALVPPDSALDDGDVVEGAGRAWRVVHTPGHDPAHLCLLSDDGLFVSGDTLLSSITPHIDFRRGAGNPLGDYLDSLARIEKLAPALVLPGHGRPFEDGAERARAIARHHDRRLGAILQVIRDRPHTALEITEAVFGPELLNFQKRLALGEALAHLAYLRQAGEVERTRGPDGVFLYRKRSRREAR